MIEIRLELIEPLPDGALEEWGHAKNSDTSASWGRAVWLDGKPGYCMVFHDRPGWYLVNARPAIDVAHRIVAGPYPNVKAAMLAYKIVFP